jgi:tetratricopeptide (TPR) repeat protein
MARYYHRGGAWAPALGEVGRARALGSADPELLYVEGDCRRALEELAAARAALEDLLRADPGHRPARLSLARVLLREQSPGAALPHFDAYFAGAGERFDVEALLEHGRALRAAGRLEDAADRFAEALERDPLEPAPYSELAQALYRLKRRQAARRVEAIYRQISQRAFDEHVEAKLKEYGQSAHYLSQRAINLAAKRRYAEAIRAFRDALELDTRDVRPRAFLAELLLRLGRRSDARAVIEEALRLGLKPDSGLRWLLSRAGIEGGDPAAALAAARAGIESLKAEGGAEGFEKGKAPALSLHLYLVRCALEAGETGLALQAAAFTAAAFERAWEPLYWRGRVELAAGDARAAAASFAQAAARGGAGFGDLDLWTANAEAALGARDAAAARLRLVVERQGGSLEAHAALVRLAGETPAGMPDLGERLRRLEARERDRRALESRYDAVPLEAAGEPASKLGEALVSEADPKGYEILFLAADLLPRDPAPIEALLAGLKRPQEAFVRVHFLRKRLALGPASAAAAALAALYLDLEVRLGEAERLALLALEAEPRPEDFILAARAARARGRDPAARQHLERGVGAFPSDEALRRELAALEAEGAR